MNTPATNSILADLKLVQKAVQDHLDTLLPAAEGDTARVLEAMRYSVFGPGKRVRPALCLWACQAVGTDSTKALSAAAALEMVHVYSLIHDDLPAMDDDDLRRGRPSCHKAFDEATAILAGDALLTEAFLALINGYGSTPELYRELSLTLAHAAGAKGMVGGQMLDIEWTEKEWQSLSQEECLAVLERLHSLKTGALLHGSVKFGALVGNATPNQLEHLENYGRIIGLAFQVADDVLDATASSEQLGKTSGKDEAQGKLTYVSLLGVEAARSLANELLDRALAELKDFSEAADPLRRLAHFIVARSH